MPITRPTDLVRPGGAAMNDTLERPIVIRLDQTPRDGKVWTFDHNDNRVLMTVEQVMNACRLYNRNASLADVHFQVKALWERIGLWLKAHSDSVQKACFAFPNPSGRVNLLVFQRGVEFNEKLSDDLTELDIEVSNHEAFSLIKLSVQLLPELPDDQVDAILSQG